LYGQRPPLVNASRAPGAWQSYDIVFRAPRFDGEKLASPGGIAGLPHAVVGRDPGLPQRRRRASCGRAARSDGASRPAEVLAARAEGPDPAAGPRESGALPERVDQADVIPREAVHASKSASTRAASSAVSPRSGART